MNYRVLLIDDHTLVRDGMKALIEQSGEFRVTGEADNGRDALLMFKQLGPDLVVVNIGLSSLNGIETARQLLRTWPKAPVLLISLSDDEEGAATAFHCGARGLVQKKASARDLLDALRTVVSGGSYFGPGARPAGGTESPGGGVGPKRLTARELEVLRLIAAGQTSKEIAERLTLSVETVRSYRKSMMRKLGVNNIASLIHVALREGLSRWTQHGTGNYT